VVPRALTAAAVAVDNFSEDLSIGELVLSRGERARRVLGWTSLIGASLLVSAVVVGSRSETPTPRSWACSRRQAPARFST